MVTTSDLITRLSKLDAPDREVDGEIWRYLMSGEPRAVLHGPIPKLTASIDAAIALAERGLPGCKVGLLPNFYKDFPYAGVIVEAGKPVDLVKLLSKAVPHLPSPSASPSCAQRRPAMVDLVLRPSNDPAKPFALQLRKHDSLGETGYFTLCRVSGELADEIISAGGAFWLFGEPKEASKP